MDIRLGAKGDDGQGDAQEREYRCLECGSEYESSGGPCPDCGARRRRYIGPIPDGGEVESHGGDVRPTHTIDEAELAVELREEYSTVLIKAGGSASRLHATKEPESLETLCQNVDPDVELYDKSVSVFPPGYWPWCSRCAAEHVGIEVGVLGEIRASQASDQVAPTPGGNRGGQQ